MQAHDGVLHQHVQDMRLHGHALRPVHGLRVPVDGAAVRGDRLLRAVR